MVVAGRSILAQYCTIGPAPRACHVKITARVAFFQLTNPLYSGEDTRRTCCKLREKYKRCAGSANSGEIYRYSHGGYRSYNLYSRERKKRTGPLSYCCACPADTPEFSSIYTSAGKPVPKHLLLTHPTKVQ